MSETTNIKLFKHDNPSTNTNQFDVEKSLNQNWDKIDTEIGNIRENINGNDTDISNLKSRVTDLETNLETAQNNIDEIKEEQITQNENIKDNTTAIEKNAESIKQNTTDITKLREENTMLKVQIPKGQASGEEITLSDSAEMELVNFGLQGNSKQNTREGYNLANYNTKVDKNTPNFDIGDIKDQQVYTLYLYIPKGTISFNLKNKNNATTILTDWNKTGKVIKTFTANQDDILHFNGFGSSSDYNGITEIMLLKGTYTLENLPTFEEYGEMPSLDYPSEVEAVGDSGSVEIIKSNKNIFEETSNLEGVTTAFTSIVKGNFRLKKDVYYTISFNTNNNGGKVYLNEDIFADVSRLNFDGNRKYITTKIKDEVKEIYKNATLLKTYEAVNIPYEISNIQIASNNDIDFIEHKGNIYTLPIQKPFYMLHFDGDVNISQKATVRDSFILKDGKWCEKHNIAKVNLEDINWYKGSAEAGTENTYKRWNSIAKYKDDKCGIAGSSNRLAISNYLANQYYKIFNVDKVGFNIENSEICIRFPISTANSPEEIKNFWQEKANEGNGAYILYPSKEPELIECTEEQTQVLEQIMADGTYKGVTHYYTTQDIKPTLEVKYYKDLETIINNQAQIQATLNNVQAQILELGGN